LSSVDFQTVGAIVTSVTALVAVYQTASGAVVRRYEQSRERDRQLFDQLHFTGFFLAISEFRRSCRRFLSGDWTGFSPTEFEKSFLILKGELRDGGSVVAGTDLTDPVEARLMSMYDTVMLILDTADQSRTAMPVESVMVEITNCLTDVVALTAEFAKKKFG
jgi:hypothetical protein